MKWKIDTLLIMAVVITGILASGCMSSDKNYEASITNINNSSMNINSSQNNAVEMNASIDEKETSNVNNSDEFYSKEVEVSNGTIKISSQMPIFFSNNTSQDLPLDELRFQTWYGCGVDDTNMYCFVTRVVDITDLTNLYLTIKLPNGETAYIKNLNLTQTQVGGKWQLNGEHNKIIGVAIMDQANKKTRSYEWNQDMPIILPDYAESEIFIFWLVVEID